ncbi:FAD-dependent oxidoreductase [Pontibacter sp. G13]|uniref:FAD-dependent oxidoreductase n=1 Tax=Pontibacter sp. G13 TaxID=3074898 RepID=UPI00288A1E5C|nr:FAD-dependent oxidoreductase [Pontibacter sp. G13]WNJ16570.1 FAD-dependent oxidoreductase [Pontibacter sp. G13]
MIQAEFQSDRRENRTQHLSAELVIVGGGIAGVCAAITAARQGTQTILVQDRPVLGGNASSEVRLWILGATSHMGNNNRWSREGGVMDELLVENMYRNPEGNAVIFDTVLLDKVLQEPNITLLLNTAVYEVTKSNAQTIQSVTAFNPQNSTRYQLSAPLFCDASGDGIVAFQAGASFRMGAEKQSEFGEGFAPDEAYGELLGHSMYFYSKSAGTPVRYIPPSYALKDITEIPRYKLISKTDMGCRFWWFEYGGRTDTIHQTEEIKYELWKVIYGVWDYIKNSGEFDDVDDLTLEWVATIPGKRESRRFEGPYILKQQDVIEQRRFEDAVAFGGWALDLHPADGIYSERSGCTQWHSKGIYSIPYRCYYSKDIDNLFLAGRIISASHVAFGSTRVMATCGAGGQAVGMAAALCTQQHLSPAGLSEDPGIQQLQEALNLIGQSIPGTAIPSGGNALNQAKYSASSALKLAEIPADREWLNLKTSAAQMIPLKARQAYSFSIQVQATAATSLEVQLRTSAHPEHFTPEVVLESQTLHLAQGVQEMTVSFSCELEEEQYGFLTFLANESVQIRQSEQRYTGVLSVFNGVNKAVSNDGSQRPPKDIGIDAFEFWIPQRRPSGHNLAMKISPTIEAFEATNLGNGWVRPIRSVNAWVADLADPTPTLTVEWEADRPVSEIRLFWDTDYDHAMESTLMGHPESVMPFCVRNYQIFDLEGQLLAEVTGNYQTLNVHALPPETHVKGLVLKMEHPSEHIPAALFEWVVR